MKIIFFIFNKLGCGTSLCGLLAAKLGSNVILTDDFNSNRSLESLVRQSIALNNIDNIKLHHLYWGNFTKEPFNALPKIDICIGSDVFFDSKSKNLKTTTTFSSTIIKN
jgi:predicted nicotinamide N-methyase